MSPRDKKTVGVLAVLAAPPVKSCVMLWTNIVATCHLSSSVRGLRLNLCCTLIRTDLCPSIRCFVRSF